MKKREKRPKRWRRHDHDNNEELHENHVHDGNGIMMAMKIRTTRVIDRRGNVITEHHFDIGGYLHRNLAIACPENSYRRRLRAHHTFGMIVCHIRRRFGFLEDVILGIEHPGNRRYPHGRTIAEAVIGTRDGTINPAQEACFRSGGL